MVLKRIIHTIFEIIISIFLDDYDNLREFWVAVIFVIVVVGLVAGITYGLTKLDDASNRRDCDVFAALNSDYEIQYISGQGCLINLDGLWVDKDGIYGLLRAGGN